MQYLDNIKLSTRDREEYTGHENLQDFTLAGNPRSIEEILDGSTPALASHRSAHFFGLFLFFWSSFVEIKVLNEEENSILHILYCYSFQQHIVLAFCNDFHTHYRVFAYILLRNNILLFPKWRQKPTRPILRYSSVVNMEKGKFTNFKNSYKINKK